MNLRTMTVGDWIATWTKSLIGLAIVSAFLSALPVVVLLVAAAVTGAAVSVSDEAPVDVEAAVDEVAAPTQSPQGEVPK